MSERVMPPKGSAESQWFLAQWDKSTSPEKRQMCNTIGISYDRAKHVVCGYRDIPINAPTVEDILSQDPDIPWADQIEIFKAMDSLVSLHMQTPSEVIIEIDTEVPIASVKTADWQLGAPGVDYDQFKNDCEFIVNEDGFYIDVGGDGYQNIIQPSKVGSSHNQIPISPQRGLFVKTLKMFGNKLKVLRTGNHNFWSTLAVGEDWENELARRLKILYMKHYGIIYWKIGKMVYKEVAMHKGRFNSSFNLTHSNKQHQRMDFPDSRIVTIEHNHIGDVEQYRYNNQECVAIRTGTYAVYDEFAQQNGFYGAHVCNPAIIMFPNEDKLIAFKDMRDAAVMLRSLRGGKLL